MKVINKITIQFDETELPMLEAVWTFIGKTRLDQLQKDFELSEDAAKLVHKFYDVMEKEFK